jgi:hypothetical protein
MMQEQWARYKAMVQSRLQPILGDVGYTLKEEGINEDNGGYAYMYEKDASNRISIDVLKRTTFVAGEARDFNWLRVGLRKGYLKELIGAASDTDMYLHDGWIWVTEDELARCIEEIATGLKPILILIQNRQ